MKNILLIPVCLVLIITVSCKKKRTCSCTDITTTVQKYPNGTSFSDTETSTYSTTAEKQTKKYFRMDNACYSYSSKSTQNNSGYIEERSSEVTCDIK